MFDPFSLLFIAFLMFLALGLSGPVGLFFGVAGLLMPIFVFIFILAGLAIFFLPSLVAFNRRVSNGWIILLINIFFGSFVIPWIILLFWAVAAPSRFLMINRTTYHSY